MNTDQDIITFDLLDRVDNLPTLPVIAQQIQKLVANPRSNMAQIAALISEDQAIAARVIKLVNSAFYGFSNRIGSIRQAIVILGLNTVKNIVVGVSVVDTFANLPGSAVFNRDAFWLHTFGCALGAKLLAGLLGKPESEDYFLAGLLHDIGILVIDQYLHKDFVRVLENMQTRGIDYMQAERNKLGCTHTEVGEYMACRWKLPAFLSYTMRWHHEPMTPCREADLFRDIISIVHLADVKTCTIPSMQSIDNSTSLYDNRVSRHLRIHESALEKIRGVVEAETGNLLKEWGL